MLSHLRTTFDVIGVLIWVLWLSLKSAIRALTPVGYLPRKSVVNEVVLITGAGCGLGRLLAERFARLGARLVLWDIDENGNQVTADACRLIGAEVHTYRVDVSNRDEVERTAEQVKQQVGCVDILFNSAGVVHGRKLLDCPSEMIERTMHINTHSHFWMLKAFLGDMLARDHGHIIEVASAAGHFGAVDLTDYCASKFAIAGLFECLVLEIAAAKKTDVHCTLVSPFFLNTGMFSGVSTSWPRIMPILEPEYAADLIVDAVLTNSYVLMMPRFIYIIYFVKGLLPACAQLYLSDFFGITSSMSHFTGRTTIS